MPLLSLILAFACAYLLQPIANSYADCHCDTCMPQSQGQESRKNMAGPGGGGWGRSKSLRISFLEAVYGFRVSFLSLSFFFII